MHQKYHLTIYFLTLWLIISMLFIPTVAQEQEPVYPGSFEDSDPAFRFEGTWERLDDTLLPVTEYKPYNTYSQSQTPQNSFNVLIAPYPWQYIRLSFITSETAGTFELCVAYRNDENASHCETVNIPATPTPLSFKYGLIVSDYFSDVQETNDLYRLTVTQIGSGVINFDYLENTDYHPSEFREIYQSILLDDNVSMSLFIQGGWLVQPATDTVNGDASNSYLMSTEPASRLTFFVGANNVITYHTIGYGDGTSAPDMRICYGLDITVIGSNCTEIDNDAPERYSHQPVLTELSIPDSEHPANRIDIAPIGTAPLTFSGMEPVATDYSAELYSDNDGGVQYRELYYAYYPQFNYKGTWEQIADAHVISDVYQYSNDPNAEIEYVFDGSFTVIYHNPDAPTTGDIEFCIWQYDTDEANADCSIITQGGVPFTIYGVEEGIYHVRLRNLGSGINAVAIQIFDGELISGYSISADHSYIFKIGDWQTLAAVYNTEDADRTNDASAFFVGSDNPASAIAFQFRGTGFMLQFAAGFNNSIRICVDDICEDIDASAATVADGTSAIVTFDGYSPGLHEVIMYPLTGTFALINVEVLAE